ncbi:PAS domain-containing protein [Hymenobacter sp. YC55]|uniref:PAS domain-containing protein n=1 Tax=Hymenobacter sp. YC55 TaxID=3034019 RepID=UPI0023F7DF5D|nr:PAS domain-containing protein [Hymenobacter sp. YC55]MDF7814706.1 PAS domain-containing protein [Hymenobacter sp. YC55]
MTNPAPKPTSVYQGLTATSSLSLFGRLVQTMPWGVLALNRLGVVTLLNAEVQRLTGLSATEAVGQLLTEVLPPDFPEDLRQTLHATATAADSVSGTFFLPHSQQWIAMTTEPGEREVLVYWQNITEVVDQKRQYQDLADNLTDGIALWGPDLRLRYANSVLVAQLNQPLLGLLGKTLTEMGAPASMSNFYTPALKQVLATGQPSDHYLAFTAPEGERHFHLRLVPDWLDGQVAQVLSIAHDITELKQAEVELRATNQFLSAAEEVARTGSYEADLKTMRFRFSDGMFHLFGEKPQSFVPTLDFIDARSYPDDAQLVRQVLDEAIANKASYHYLRRIHHADGKTRQLESHGYVVCDEAGEPIKLVGQVQDITERHEAETQLLQATQTIRHMLDGSPAAICLLEARRDEQTGQIIDFIFRGANQASEILNQKSEACLLGHGLLEYFPGVRGVFFDNYVRVVETGEPLRLDRCYTGEHYHERWFDVSAVKNGDGIILTFLDITDRKRNEQEQAASKRLLEAIFEATLNSLEVFRSVRDDTGQVVDFEWVLANKAAHRLVQRTDLTGKRLLAEEPAMKQSGVFERLRQVVEQKQSTDFEEHYPYDGNDAWYHIAAAPLNDGLVVNWQDITASKRATAAMLHLQLTQQQKLANAVLEAQESERRRIAESLHNGLNQLLYATKLHLEQLVPPTAPNFAEGKKKAMALLSDAISQGRTLSHQLMPTALETFGLKAALKGICHDLNSSKLHLSCSVVSFPSLNKSLELALYRMAQELANNVVKHADATQAHLNLVEHDGWLELQADDNGRGFDPGKARTQGMGLNALRDRVKLLGGEMTILSSPEHGTQITIRIPRTALKTEQAPPSP